MPNMKDTKSPLARELAEYALLLSDIKDALAMMTLYFDKYAAIPDLPAEERLLALSVFRDAVTTFVACFDDRVASHLDKEKIYSSIENGIANFTWLKDVRDSYAAHRFGPYRQCVIGIFPSEDNSSVIGIGETRLVYAGPAAAARDSLLSFIGFALDHVQALFSEKSEQFLAEAKNLSPQQIAQMEDAVVYNIRSPAHVRISRERFQRLASVRKTTPEASS